MVIERGPVAAFAEAVLDGSAVYKSPAAAAAEGLAGVPAPPTFPMAFERWGRFEEIQPEPAEDSSSAAFSPFAAVIGPLLQKGGLLLHGEQAFTYHRPVVVGDVLVGEGVVADVYEKESNGKTLTFLVVDTNWTDDRTGEPVVTARSNLIHRA